MDKFRFKIMAVRTAFYLCSIVIAAIVLPFALTGILLLGFSVIARALGFLLIGEKESAISALNDIL